MRVEIVVNCPSSRPDCPGFDPVYPDIEVCSRCGLGRTRTPTAAIDQQDYLNGRDVGGAERPQYFKALFGSYCKNVPPGRALDVGCGQGEWVRLLASRGWTAHGIDAFRAFTPDEVNFFRSIPEDYFPEAPYDFVTLVHCFEHLSQPASSLENLKRLLAPHGKLLIVVPNFGGAWSRLYGADWHMLRPDHHAFHYTRESLEGLLRTCGFDILQVSTCSIYAPSMFQLRLNRTRFYPRMTSVRPIQSIASRITEIMRPVLNKQLDAGLDGAEIHILASVKQGVI